MQAPLMRMAEEPEGQRDLGAPQWHRGFSVADTLRPVPPSSEVVGHMTRLLIDGVTSHLEESAPSEVPPLHTFEKLAPEVMRQAREKVDQARLGKLAVAETVEGPPQYRSLLDMLHAPEHDEQAEAAGILNFKTKLQESVNPYRHVMEVEAKVVNGEVWQFGYGANAMVTSTLRLDKSETRIVESVNLVAIGLMVQQNILEEGDVVLDASIIPPGEAKDLRAEGYFTHSATYILRAIKVGPNGTLKIRSFFNAGADFKTIEESVTGIEGPALYEERERVAMEARHDKRVLRQLFGRVFNHPVTTDDAAGFMSLIGVLNREQFPNGEVDVQRQLDAITAEELGSESVFFGVRDELGDHEAFIKQCLQENAEIDAQARQCWQEARAYAMTHPGLTEADIPGLFQNIVKRFVAEKALDGQLSVAALGAEAAYTAVQYQAARDRGEHELAATLRERTIDRTNPGGCPTPGAQASSIAQNSGEASRGSGEGDDGTGEHHNGCCRIPGCPNSNRVVRVGGCDICLSSCQPKFNKGMTYDQIVAMYARKKQRSQSLKPSAMPGEHKQRKSTANKAARAVKK